LKLFVGNTSGLTEADICAAVHPIAILDAQINAKGFSFAILDAPDAVELVAKYSLGLVVPNGRKIYFHAPKDKKAAVAFAAARAKMQAFAPKTKKKIPAPDSSSFQEPLRYPLADGIVPMQIPTLEPTLMPDRAHSHRDPSFAPPNQYKPTPPQQPLDWSNNLAPARNSNSTVL
jgi:hypothetical protein